MENNSQVGTSAIDLFAPSNRFASSAHIRGRLQRYRLVWRRYWWVVALLLIAVLGAAGFYSAQLPPMYRSTARMWLTGRLNINEGRLYTEELIDYLATQVELLNSSTVQHRALAK